MLLHPDTPGFCAFCQNPTHKLSDGEFDMICLDCSRGEESSGGGNHGVDGVHNPDEDFIEYDSVLDEADVAFKDASAGAPQKDRKFAQHALDDLVKDKSFFKNPKQDRLDKPTRKYECLQEGCIDPSTKRPRRTESSSVKKKPQLECACRGKKTNPIG